MPRPKPIFVRLSGPRAQRLPDRGHFEVGVDVDDQRKLIEAGPGARVVLVGSFGGSRRRRAKAARFRGVEYTHCGCGLRGCGLPVFTFSRGGVA